MITSAEIEALAREACRQMGLDPEDWGVFAAPESGLYADRRLLVRWVSEGLPGSMKAWRYFVEDAERAIAMHRAIKKLGGQDD